ncbi:MAG: type II toxin-antitoxin system RelE/ParE family toxin [Alphaproteobacteria bacterium]|jgi:plasmid stabilization system protein ParE|nr:type II toxin-antitoxin system RelE/ParE family toxin [Alphaproteobacteria bacterium]
MKIFYTTDFNNAILEIESYLRNHYPTYLKPTRLQIKQKINALIKNPYIGRIGREAGTREAVFAKLPYFIVYEVNEDMQEVVLHDIFHTSRNYPLQ